MTLAFNALPTSQAAVWPMDLADPSPTCQAAASSTNCSVVASPRDQVWVYSTVLALFVSTSITNATFPTVVFAWVDPKYRATASSKGLLE